LCHNNPVSATLDFARLKPQTTPGAQVIALTPGHWRLEIPAGPAGQYRLAQLDDYAGLPRAQFYWHPPVDLVFQMRASAVNLPGTWGFGLWNDPFNLSLGLGGAARRFPALPNAVWFFFASLPNHLSLHDGLPGQGQLAATFASPRFREWLLALLSPSLAGLAFPPLARLARRLLQRIVHQDTRKMVHDPRNWHAYRLVWKADHVNLAVDGLTVLATPIVPHSPLGFVLWIDNQHAAFPPDGRLGFGSLPNPEPAWIEVRLA
jgi:hypothetical protein